MLAPERLLRPELIVRPTANPEILSIVRAAKRTWIGMIELEKCSPVAALPLGRDIGALQAVAFEDAASCRVRDSCGRRGSGLSRAARTFRPCQPLSLEIGE